MANIDALAGLARARRRTTNVPGTCLGFVYEAYGSVQSIGRGAGKYGVAVAGWDYSDQQHPGDRNPPAGAPIWFGRSPDRVDKNKNAGDVGISLGGGLGWFTDAAGNGRTGIMTIAAREKQTHRPYLGWTSDFLGHQLVNLGPISYPAPAAPGGNPLVRAQQVKLNKLGFNLVEDGLRGPATRKAIRELQGKHGLVSDSVWGTNTENLVNRLLAGDGSKQAPAYPLPDGYFFGPKEGGVRSVSGYFSHRDALRQWQLRMIERGWSFGPAGADGLYGKWVGDVAEAFQAEKGLKKDRLIGKDTWAYAWTAPIT